MIEELNKSCCRYSLAGSVISSDDMIPMMKDVSIIDNRTMPTDSKMILFRIELILAPYILCMFTDLMRRGIKAMKKLK
jgi:hypothetical protein